MTLISEMESNVAMMLPDIICGLQDMRPYLDWIDKERLNKALLDFIMLTIYPWNLSKQEHADMRVKYLEGYYDFLEIWRTISSGFEGEDDIQVHVDASRNVKDVCNWVLFKFHPRQ